MLAWKMGGSNRAGSAAATAAMAVVLILLLWRFSSAARKDPPVSGKTSREAGDLLAQVNNRFDARDFAAADSLARVFLSQYPGDPRGDEALHTAARASYTLGSYPQTIKYAEELSAKYPLSPRREETLRLESDAYARIGRYYESADVLSRLLTLPLDPALRQKCVEDLRQLAAGKLGEAELEKLAAAYPSSPLASEISYELARREFARGNYDRAFALLSDLVSRYPQHVHAKEIRYLMEVSASRKTSENRVSTHVVPNKIGIILPSTGEYSRYGRFFEEGVRIALDEYNASADAKADCVFGDSKADPIAAVLAVRRLIVDDGVVAIVGPVFTVPSIAAETECNAWRVPIVAPLVREPNFRRIGPWVFQTVVPVEVEVAAMAKVAVGSLMLERIAVLAPETPEGRRLAGLFVDEVKRRGAEVITQEYFELGDTDFREQLGRIRVKAPDAMFIPGGADELVNILPQVRFYDLQIQLLGLSNWNSEKLSRLATRELEGAVFPREGYYGRNPDAYARFAARYLEKHPSEIPGSNVDDVSPVAAAGYFGARFILDAIAAGAVDREQIKESLDRELNASAEARLKEVESLPLLKIVSGTPREFTPPKR